MLSEYVLLEYADGKVRNKILVNVECLKSCLDKYMRVSSSVEFFTYLSAIMSNLIRLIDEGWEVRRAVYNSIYTLLKYVGFKDYFAIARAVDECSTCFRCDN